MMNDFNDFPIYKQQGYDINQRGDIPYFLITIVFSVSIFALEWYLNRRQINKYIKSTELPNQLKDSITDETFKKTISYGLDKLSFQSTESLFMFIESLVLSLLGYLPYLWDQSTNACRYLGVCDNSYYSALSQEIAITIVFLALSTVHDTIISLPFALYGTFVVEQKHGFNKTTVALFFRDKALMLLLTTVIGSPIISIIILLVRWGGEYFYFYVWLFLAIVSILLMTIYPIYIAPLFNKYTRLESGPIYQAIEGLAEKVKFPLTEIYVVDGSKRSAHSNAYFYGFFKNKRIVLYDTLLSQVSQSELLAILGHEIGHWKLWHTASNFLIGQIYTFVLFLSFSTVQRSPQLFASFGFACGLNVPVFIGLMLFAQTFWSPVEKLLSLVMNFYSRSNEFAADEYSAKLGMGAELASGLIKISIENLGNLVPDSLYSLYHFSHPPLVERLSALQIQSKKLE